MMPKISVIVPVYNVEKHLSRCINSILNQTFTDFELILVDDGSPDNCGIICDEYAAKDHRIVVIHKKNGGVCSARNIGIERSKGDFLAFVDSDDYIDVRYLEYLYRFSENDLIACIVLCVNGLCESVIPQKLKGFSEFSNLDIPFLYMHFDMFPHYNKLYKSNIIKKNNITFPNFYNWGEDSIFVTEYLKYTSKIVFLDYCGYIYCQNNDNSLSTKLRSDIVDEISNSRLECLQNLKSCCNDSKELNEYFCDNIKSNISFFIQRAFENKGIGFKKRVKALKKFKKNSFVKETIKDSNKYYNSAISISLRFKTSFLQILCYDFLMFLRRIKKRK